MPIFDQGYQHWNGRFRSQIWLPGVITARGVKVQWRNRWVRWILFTSLCPAFLLTVFLVIWGLFESKSSLLTPFLFLFKGLPEELQAGPQAFRLAIWTFAVRQFFNTQIYFTLLIVLLVGPDLISQDLRFNAIPLYLSRPLRRWEYFLGKLGVIAVFLAVVSIVPVMLAFLLGFAFSLDPTVIRDTWRLFLGSMAYGAIVVVSAGLLMLAFSALSRNSRIVGAAWLSFWLVSVASSSVLEETIEQDWCVLASYPRNLLRVRDGLLGAEAAWDQMMRLTEASEETVGAMAGSLVRMGGSRFNPAVKNSGRRRPLEREDRTRRRRTTRLERFAPDRFPLWWSCAVLGGLAAASLAVLSTRVRSLDRLG